MAQIVLGMHYYYGEGVPQDDVATYMWLDLGGSGTTEGLRNSTLPFRDRAAERLTSDQLAEAQRLVREWNEAHPR